MKKLIPLLLVWLFVPMLLSAKPRVVVTTTMLAELVQALAQDDFEVVALMPAGADPHQYRMTTRDLSSILQADLVIINGLRLEGRLADTLKQAQKRDIAILSVGDLLPKERLIGDTNVEHGFDPHIWGDVTLWIEVVPLVNQALGRLLPEHQSQLTERAEQYQANLKALDSDLRQIISTIPANSRVLITSHDAFGYLGRAYGLEVHGIQGLSTTSEAGLGDLANLSKLIREREVRAIFAESSVSPALIRRLGQESGAKIGNELFSDSMGAAGEVRKIGAQEFRTDTYEGMMKYNATAIATGLTGQ
jgi:manganese/zinc/iron transport system substrate-binding protein